MANPIILHCFDEDYNINEEAVTKLFRNPTGVIDLAASRNKMFDMLSIMELDDDFMIKHLEKLDIPKLIVRRTLTKQVFEERFETIFKFIIEGTASTLDDRFNLIKLYMSQNMSSEEIDRNIMNFMYTIKHNIMKIANTDKELDDYLENYLMLLYRVNNLFLIHYSKIFETTEHDKVTTSLFGASLIIYMVKNPNAPIIVDGEPLDITDADIIEAVNVDDSLLSVRQFRRKFYKIIEYLDNLVEEA